MTNNKPKLIRITSAPISLKYLLANQMRFMNENGFDVLMISGEGNEWNDIIKNEQCRYKIIPLEREISIFKDIKSLWELFKLFRNEEPDIVHSHTPKAGLIAMLAAKLAGVKFRIHTIAGLRFVTAKGLFRKILIATEKITYWASTHVWANSFSILKFVNENNLCEKDKLGIIGFGSSNGIDLKRYTANNLQQEIIDDVKKQIKYSDECFYILSIGRIVKDKGIEELVDVFSELYNQHKNFRLIVLGKFEDESDPVSLETKNKIKTHSGIIQIDWSDNVEYFLHVSHLLVHASYREGFPNVLLQAGAMNCPIVCSRIDGNIDIVDDNETGKLFEVRDKNSLSNSLQFAISNYSQMKEFAQALKTKIETHFSQTNIHNCLKEKYVELLNNTNA